MTLSGVTHRSGRPGAWLLIALTLLGFAITLRRTPTPSPDATLYASIARSWQLYGDGLPSMQRDSPAAVDHIRFYGPVFFSIVTGAFRLYGFSMGSFRLVSLVSTVMIAIAGGVLARALSGERDRALWALALLLLTPELGVSATGGTMDPVGVAFEMAALATFVVGVARGARPAWYGLGAGVFLALAALTTPRTWLFIAAFMAGAAALLWTQRGRARATWIALAVAAATLVVTVAAWGTHADANPIRWARYIGFIVTHEDTDVAILPAATRIWAMNWRYVITPAAAIAGALLAAPALAAPDQSGARVRDAAVFAIVVGWITLVVTVCVINLTFSCSIYLAVPLFATVIALPRRYLRIGGGTLAVAAGCLLAFDIAVKTLEYGRVASTWSARNPDRIAAFVRERVPPGSDVIGPEGVYFWAVETNGSRYLSIWPESWADWARWVPRVEPEAVGARPRRRPMAGRFLLWQSQYALPPEYACARDHVAGVFPAPPDDLDLPGTLEITADRGYRETVLYALDPQCPASGYNPSGSTATAR